MIGEGHKVDNLVHVAFFVLCEALPLYKADAQAVTGGTEESVAAEKADNA